MQLGVCGTGFLGSRHARKLAARGGLPLLLHDRDAEKARALAGEISAAAVDSLDALRERCDAVIVATSTDAHAAVTLALLESGCHVLVEKPIAGTLSDADRMIVAAKQAGRVLMVGHVERFNPVFRGLADRVRGTRFIEGHRLAEFKPRSLDVDVVLDLMIHDIDIVLSVVGEFPFRIDAAGTPVLTGRVDIANARLQFPGGAVANLTASRVSLSRTRKIRFFMPEHYVSVDLGLARANCYSLRPGAETDFVSRIDHEALSGAGSDALETEPDAFLKACAGEGPVVVPGEDGRAALAVALSIANRLAGRPA